VRPPPPSRVSGRGKGGGRRSCFPSFLFFSIPFSPISTKRCSSPPPSLYQLKVFSSLCKRQRACRESPFPFPLLFSLLPFPRLSRYCGGFRENVSFPFSPLSIFFCPFPSLLKTNSPSRASLFLFQSPFPFSLKKQKNKEFSPPSKPVPYLFLSPPPR